MIFIEVGAVGIGKNTNAPLTAKAKLPQKINGLNLLLPFLGLKLSIIAPTIGSLTPSQMLSIKMIIATMPASNPM